MRPVTVGRASWRLACAAVLVACLIPLAGGAAGADDVTMHAADVAHPRTSRLDLDLISRTYDAGSGQWTVVVESRLDSNRLCVPAVFDCIVEPGTTPAGATLTSVQCLSPWWGHLGIFTSSCLKQLFSAGWHQRFRYTYVTDAAAAPTELRLSSLFGRGLFPIMLQRLAQAELVVSLTSELDLSQACPTDPVRAGDSFECDLTVTYPTGPVAGVPVTIATLNDVVTGTTASTLTGITTSSPDWSCAGGSCTLTGQMDSGDQALFTAAVTATASTTGGELTSTAALAYGSPQQEATSVEHITVVGSGDTDLTVTKVANQSTAQPGQQVSWTVTVTNSGVAGSAALPASDVVLGDVAPDLVTGLTAAFVSGVGSWTCAGPSCTAATMPPGAATFTVTATLAATATAGSAVVNEVDVAWTNDVVGPDHPVVAGVSFEVAATPTTTPTTTTTTTAPAATPSRLAFTG